MLEAFFAADAPDSVFAAGCTLASVLDQAEWNLYETALGKLVLESTGRNLAATATTSTSQRPEAAAEFGQVDKKTNSLALLGKLTKSERLRKLVQKGGQAAAAWETNVTRVAQNVIANWKTAYEQSVDEVDEEQASCDLLPLLHCSSNACSSRCDWTDFRTPRRPSHLAFC